ncbi:MAG: transposase [Mycoplasmataceae bacterium]|jgi:transposase|nr:transposase [Mycoplasmataceae bacterium]
MTMEKNVKKATHDRAYNYFADPKYCPNRKRYEALKKYLGPEQWSAEKVSQVFGYAIHTIYMMAYEFRNEIADNRNDEGPDPFFISNSHGRKKLSLDEELKNLIIECRKKSLSVIDIKSILDSKEIKISQRTITNILNEAGFTRLSRRDKVQRASATSELKGNVVIEAPKCSMLKFDKEKEQFKFTSQQAGILQFLPILKHYEIDSAIADSLYPSTSVISKNSAILSFLALKLSNIERYSHDDAWCMDRALGLFAGLNVLPKAAWFSSYSSSITRNMNIDFMKKLNCIWSSKGLLSDTVNLDFTAIPYLGDDDHLENNWSGKRSKALASLQAVLAQDPDGGILCYGDTTIKHDNQNQVIVEFLDFYSNDKKINKNLKYLIFDSKFTTYTHLGELDKKGIKFITIQRRGKNLVNKINEIPKEQWKKISIEKANHKRRYVTASECFCDLLGYKSTDNIRQIRQIFLKDTGRIKPSIIITNDFDTSIEFIVRKYSNRWLVEKEISEQIHFFHLNRNSSGIVVKVDFDLTLSILAHNIYRLMAKEFDGFSHCEAQTIYNKFIDNTGQIVINEESVNVYLNKKRHLPIILDSLIGLSRYNFSLFDNKILAIMASSTT